MRSRPHSIVAGLSLQLNSPITSRRGVRRVSVKSQIRGIGSSNRSTGRGSSPWLGMVRFKRSTRSGGSLEKSSLLKFNCPVTATQEQIARACSSGTFSRT